MAHKIPMPPLPKQRKRAPVRNILVLAQKPSVFTQTQNNWKFMKWTWLVSAIGIFTIQLTGCSNLPKLVPIQNEHQYC